MVVEILDVVIPANMQLEVTYSIQDPSGLPLDAEGIHTPGEVDMRFTIANIPMGEEEARRIVVEDYSCESCHVNLSLHGGGRNDANYCTTCHGEGKSSADEKVHAR